MENRFVISATTVEKKFEDAMKHGNSHRRSGRASSSLDDEDEDPSQPLHYSFAGGEEDGKRNGDVFVKLRQTNGAKMASARMSRPHKTG